MYTQDELNSLYEYAAEMRNAGHNGSSNVLNGGWECYSYCSECDRLAELSPIKKFDIQGIDYGKNFTHPLAKFLRSMVEGDTIKIKDVPKIQLTETPYCIFKGDKNFPSLWRVTGIKV